MATSPSSPNAARSYRAAWALALALCAVLTAAASLAAAEPVRVTAASSDPVHLDSSAPVPAGPGPVIAGGTWDRFWHFVEDTLNNRRRMLQLATIGMCLALYIMMRK